MAKQFHVKVKDMTPEERKAYRLHQKRISLYAEMNKADREWEEFKEKMLEDSDPDYARMKKALRKMERLNDELRLAIRKKKYDMLPDKEKIIYDKLGMNPYKNQIVHRSTGKFLETGSYIIKEDK